jgi:hypothetical protein
MKDLSPHEGEEWKSGNDRDQIRFARCVATTSRPVQVVGPARVF